MRSAAFLFAVRKGFEPPVRANVHLFSRQAPSTTRTPHRLGVQIYDYFFNLQPLGLLEPLGEVILGEEVVDEESDPAGDENEHDGDDFAYGGDGFLEDVKDGKDREDDTGNVDDGC